MSNGVNNRYTSLAMVLVLVAVILFVLSGFGVKLGHFSEEDQIAFGLAFAFAAQLVP